MDYTFVSEGFKYITMDYTWYVAQIIFLCVSIMAIHVLWIYADAVIRYKKFEKYIKDTKQQKAYKEWQKDEDI